jgi:hypothetical protein
MVNRQYAQTVYLEDFSSSQTFTNDWTASFFTKDNSLYSFVDSSATIHLDEINGELKLSMLNIPGGYTNTYWGSTFITNFISGEMTSNDSFGYGVYQCKAKFAYNKGSFPAFWLYNDSDCHISKRNEIDIVECKVDHSNPTLDNNMFYYPTNCGASIGYGFKDHQFNSWGQSHVFECVYAPNRIEFWVDDSLYHTVSNNGDYRFPDQMMRFILSQQVVRYNGGQNEIITPQTSTFYWVKAKEFFLAPEITITHPVCTTGSAVLDVDTDADSITWSLTPINLFSGETSGTGKTVSITATTGARGQAKITYTFKMPGVLSSEIFTTEKTFWVGDPDNIEVYDDPTYFECGQMNIVNVDYGDYTYYDMGINQVNWSYQGTTLSNINDGFTKAYITAGDNEGNGYIYVDAYNNCGSSGDRVYYEIECFMMRILLTPNPTTSETTLSIESDSEEILFDETTEWDLEIYDQTQSLKEKKTIRQGKSTKIQTAGWKEGVYAVRVKYKDEILLGKLVVKK